MTLRQRRRRGNRRYQYAYFWRSNYRKRRRRRRRRQKTTVAMVKDGRGSQRIACLSFDFAYLGWSQMGKAGPTKVKFTAKDLGDRR